MTSETNQKRVLALDVRPMSFGYVLFEGPDRLLDWGVRSFRKGVNAVRVSRAKKLETLLEEFMPSVLVLKQPRPRSKRRKFVSATLAKTNRCGVAVRPVDSSSIKKAFGGEKRLTKYQIASALAERFPELTWRLPPKRKIWQSEDYRMSIFDAAALGTAYFARCAKHTSKEAPVPQEPS